MKTLFLTLVLLGQVPNIGGDPVEISKDEIKRRGNMVEPMGLISGDADAKVISEALRPPERDDDKWYLTVICDTGCQPCERLKYDIANNKEFRSWVNVGEPLKSPLHYQVRNIKDPTQKDWFAGIREQLELKAKYPAVVLQPPRNGSFGPCKTVVKIIYGYDGDAVTYTDKLRDAIVVYAKEVRKIRATEGSYTLPKLSPVLRNALLPVSNQVIAVGQESIGQQPTLAKPIGGAPPFAVQPQQPLQTPMDWPATPPPTLTITDMQRLIPGAPAEFILSMNSQGVKDAATLGLHWQVYSAKNQQAVTPAPVQPQLPTVQPSVCIPPKKAENNIETWTTNQLVWLMAQVVHGFFQIGTLIAVFLLIWTVRTDRTKIANLQQFQAEVNRRMNPTPTASGTM